MTIKDKAEEIIDGIKEKLDGDCCDNEECCEIEECCDTDDCCVDEDCCDGFQLDDRIAEKVKQIIKTVSYTHLTLPTITEV